MGLEGGAELFAQSPLFYARSDDAVRYEDRRDDEVINIPDRACDRNKRHSEVHGMATHSVEAVSGKRPIYRRFSTKH